MQKGDEMTNVDENLALAPASELAELIAAKQVSPVEVTELYFKRIEELDGRFNAYLTLTQEQAMQDARSAETAVMNGDSLGPLHGVPISIKDLEMTRGVRTTSGSLVFKDRVPEEDSVVVERVKSSGAVILGKTNTPEFGFRGSTENRLGEPCRNPWNPQRTPGGSSGGAAASVLAGMCSIATGSDGGGSIRIPASFCGIYGIKPSQGRVPRYAGAGAAVAANQLGQSGPLSRTVRDSAILLRLLAGYDSRDPTSLRDAPGDYVAALVQDISDLRIAWSPDFGYAPVDPEVVSITSEAARVFEELGCVVDDSKLKLEEPGKGFRVIFSTNVYAGLGHLLEEQGDELTDYVREGLEFGRDTTGADYARALGYRDVLKAQFADLFEEYDLILSPTMAVPAFPVGEAPAQIAGVDVDPFLGFLPFTYPINMIGNPAASVPCGFSSDGLPIGLHIIGRFGDEETVLAASAAFERVRPWIQNRPELV
jgi:aspartyl-tRNA(Asn)/glutamyl-tRNA(Gln) amidotransferase subunit A